MKLHAIMKNERYGKKTMSDDTRIQVELSYKNKIVGTLSLYAIIDDKVEGYRILLDNEIIKQEENGKKQKDNICAACKIAGKNKAECKEYIW